MAGKKRNEAENKDPELSVKDHNYLALVANLMISILLLVVGLSMLFIAGMKPLYYTYIIIGFLLVWGITCTVRYFVKEEFRIISNYDLAFGILILILSACMLLRAEKVSSYFHLLLGCLTLVESVVLLQHTVQMKQLKGAAWFLNLVMSLLLIAYSVITILHLDKVLDPNSQIFYILLVIAALFGLISQILVAFRAKGFRKEEIKQKREEEEKIEDFEPAGQEEIGNEKASESGDKSVNSSTTSPVEGRDKEGSDESSDESSDEGSDESSDEGPDESASAWTEADDAYFKQIKK
ncbi:MAG: DUF308 domain-containing protein [Lachnospiraceae bacterium]|nr:DUF308 domain-containing protein [Lachnospiraceae bacterium]